VLELRALRARLESPEVASFATTAADQLALQGMAREIDRTLLASNAACALAFGGLEGGAEIARTNLRELAAIASAGERAIEAAADPGAAALARALRVRCESIVAVLDALETRPPDAAAVEAAATTLDQLADWLLDVRTRNLRTALASTGIFRDALALRMLAAVCRALEGTHLSVVAALDAMRPLSSLLGGVDRPRDSAAIASSWATALGVYRGQGALAIVADTSWVEAAAHRAKQGGESPTFDAIFAPFWALTVRHSQAEGFIFVSGRQYEGLTLVPASASAEGTLLLDTSEPLARAVVGVLHAPPSRGAPTAPIDAVCIGPEAARRVAKQVLGQRGHRNVVLGEARLVYLPVARITLLGPRGSRAIALSPAGPLPLDPGQAGKRIQALREAASRAVAPGNTAG
jgi:hypothetical protein